MKMLSRPPLLIQYANLFFFILSGFLLQNCHYVGLQRAYIPATSDPHFFEKKEDQILTPSIDLTNVQVQYGRALGAHHGMSSWAYAGFKGQLGGQISGLIFHQIGKKWYWESSIGYRFMRNYSKIRSRPSFIPFTPAPYWGPYYSHINQVNYHMLPIQTHLLRKGEINNYLKGFNYKASFSLQFSPVWFEYYNYQSRYHESCELCYIRRNILLTRNKWAFSASPSLMCSIGKNGKYVFLKAGVNFISKIGVVQSPPMNSIPPPRIFYRHPQVVPAFLRMGITLNLNKS